MTQYYLLGTMYDGPEAYAFFAEPLETTTTLEDALDEGLRALVAAASDDEALFPSFDEVHEAQVVAVHDSRTVDLEQCQAMYDAARSRHEEARRAWEEQYNTLRDELGHWRTLHRRGAAPSAQVTLLEDRLSAHLAHRPQ